MIWLDLNENPLGPSPRAVEAMGRALAGAHRYPRGEGLRAALARRWGRPPSWITVGCGGDDLIRRAALAILPEGPVYAFHPTFTVYARDAAKAGRRYLPLALDAQGAPQPRELAARPEWAPEPGLVVVVSPNNPTGAYAPLEETLALARARPDLVVWLDEAYVEFGPEPLGSRAVAAEAWPDNLIALRTFSKAYGLAGLRVGYAVAPPPWAERLAAAGDPLPVGVVSEAGALAALEDEAHVERTRALVRGERERLRRQLAALGVECSPSEANFLLVRLGEGAEPLRQRLREAGISVRSGGRLGVPGTLRVSVGRPEENDALIAALSRLRVGIGGPVGAGAWH